MITSEQNSLIIGSMLGDGHLRKRKSTWNTSLIIKRSSSDILYLQNQFNIIEEFVTDAKIVQKSTFDKRTNKTYYSCSFSTKALEELNSYYKDWYFNSIKTIPNSLKLDALSIAIWLFDDGHISQSNDRLKIDLYTNCFTLDEVVFLRDLLSDRYSEDFKVFKNNKQQYSLCCADASSLAIAKDIQSYFYMLPRKSILLQNRLSKNLKITKSYNKDKMFSLIKHLNTIDSFTVKEVADKFDFYSNGEISSSLYALLRRLVSNKNITKENSIYTISNLKEVVNKYEKSTL